MVERIQETVHGVGSSTASKLEQNGIEDIEDLANAEPEEIDGISEGKCRKIIERAGQELIQSQTAADLLDEYKDTEYVSSGVDGLDNLLGGGWEPETVAMVYGASGTGKTQILFSSLSAAASEGTVVYLMTEMQGKTIAQRLEQLAETADDLDNIHIYQANDVDEQYEAYLKIAEDHDDIELMVVDSMTAQFRMTERFDGRGDLGERSAVLGKHLRQIGDMSEVFSMPVLLSGQVYPQPDRFGKDDELWGGEKMKHFISYFLRMQDSGGVLFEASIENHAGLPENSIEITIGEHGIEEV